MKNLKKTITRLVPERLWRFIDPDSHRIRDFAASLEKELKNGEKILDAGAGEAPYKSYFPNQFYHAIDTAWGDPQWNYSNINSIGNLSELPFAGKTFDAVLCTQVLEHVNEPFSVISEFHRVMKPNGILFLSAPQGWGVHQAPYDYFRYTRFGLKHLLEKAGFKIISIKETCGYYGYLANRLTVLPKVLFWQLKLWMRIIFLPFEILFYFLFVLLFPIILNSMDSLDRKRDYTLNYLVIAKK